MALVGVIGTGRAFDGREAGISAARQALEQVGRTPGQFAWVIASQDYLIEQVMAGVASVMGNTSLLGFSASGELTSLGVGRRSVVVALLAGESVWAHSGWWPGFAEDTSACVGRLVSGLIPPFPDRGVLFLAAEGVNGDAAQLGGLLPKGNYKVAGCLAGGELLSGRTYQLGGKQCGSGGLAGAWLEGRLAMGVGVDHGWKSFGPYFNLTRVQGVWVRALNDRRPSDVYAELFKVSAREWSFPPLNHLVRQYPFGLQTPEGLLVRSPIHLEADGSLRMNTVLPEGGLVYLLTSSASLCLEAARNAARNALADLGSAKPILALVFADVAWQTIFQAQPGGEVQAVRSLLGLDVPIAGGYVLGQLAIANERDQCQFYNQHIEVILVGEKRDVLAV